MSRFDVEQCGIVFVQNMRDADILFVTGAITKKATQWIKYIYEQMSKPNYVIAIGSCACGEGLFKNSYNTQLALDKIIPIDVYVPGCPPRPEAIILGIAKAIEIVKNRKDSV
jgi:NADH:ubiquinone oxidoreductase subunit B-like Fe-S oxidoreductase